MPTYVYACNECDAQFEKFQRFSDEPIKICPRCQGQVRRVFQPVGIMFKGSGWYITDSRSTSSSSIKSSKETSDSSASETKSESSTGSETNTEKPAASTDASATSTKSEAPAKSTADTAKTTAS